MMYLDYRLALAMNEEARQAAAKERLIKAEGLDSWSKLTKALQTLGNKQPVQGKGKYGLQ
jgi:hypothetical protein